MGGLLISGLLALFAWNASSSAALREAEAAYQRNKLTTALNSALVHLKRRPWSRSAALVAARSLSRLQQADRAEPYYRRAGTLGHADLHVRAYGLVQGNHRERAIQAYQAILQRRPDDVLALRRLAGVLLSERRNDETIDVAERLIQIPEGVVIGYTLKGVVYYNARRPEQSVPAFERVLELDPDLRQMPLKPRELFWIYLGNDLLALGQASQARRYLTRAIGESDDPHLVNLLAHAHKLEGSMEEAERCWRLVVERHPGLPMPWHELGLLALHRGDPVAAIASLERAAALAPGAPQPYYGLSLAHRRLGHRDEADRYLKEHARRASRTGPTTPGMSELSSPER